MEARAKKPLVTANQVTFLRLLLIPLPCWMLYQSETARLWAIFIATLLGCTDFVDGYLARMQGPTVLGSLLDPIADKVFVAITWLPALTILKIPQWWVVMLLFIREFSITALRSVYERRGTALKSSYLARYKTWVQMIAIGLFFLFPIVPKRTMVLMLSGLTVLPMIAWLIMHFALHRRWKGGLSFFLSFSGFCALVAFGGIELTSYVLVAFTLVVTWWSGIEYIANINKLDGRVTAGEIVRLLGSVAIPVLSILVQLRTPIPTWIIITFVSVELSHGGFENLLAHHRDEASTLSWGGRVLVECVLLGVILTQPALGVPAGLAALALAVVGFAIPLWTKRKYYLVDKLRTPAASIAALQ